MQEIIGVKFRNASKVYYFDPKDLDIHYNDHVIVETVRGRPCGGSSSEPSFWPR